MKKKIEFLKDLGLEKSGLDKLIQASYKLLGLISFLTAGPMESRAWTIKKKELLLLKQLVKFTLILKGGDLLEQKLSPLMI